MSLFSRLAYVGKVLTGQKPREKEIKRIRRIAESLKRKGYVFTERFSPSEYSYDVLKSIGENWLKSHVMELSKPDIIKPEIPKPVIPKIPEPIKVPEEIQKAYDKGIYMSNKYGDLTKVADTLGIDREALRALGEEGLFEYDDTGHIADIDEGLVLVEQIKRELEEFPLFHGDVAGWIDNKLSEMSSQEIMEMVKRVKENAEHFWETLDAIASYDGSGGGELQGLFEEATYIITGKRYPFKRRGK